MYLRIKLKLPLVPLGYTEDYIDNTAAQYVCVSYDYIHTCVIRDYVCAALIYACMNANMYLRIYNVEIALGAHRRCVSQTNDTKQTTPQHSMYINRMTTYTCV